MVYAAEQLSAGRFVVRPAGCLGTCGYQGGKPWQAIFVNASTAVKALEKAAQRRNVPGVQS